MHNLLKQYKIPWVGGAKETLAQAAFYISMINFVLIAATAYNTTIKDWIVTAEMEWLSFPLFIGGITFMVLLVMVFEYKYIVPSLFAFRGQQMFEHESVVIDKLEAIERRLGMAIPIERLACGNCTLRDKEGNCGIDGILVDETRPSCTHIFKHYEDRGFTPNYSIPWKGATK